MKKTPHQLLLMLLLTLTLTACSSIDQSETNSPNISETIEPLNTETTEPTLTELPKTETLEPTQNAIATVTSILEIASDTMVVEGNKVIFPEWGFSVEFPSDDWKFEPEYYIKESDFEGFVFLKTPGLKNENGEIYRPSAGVLFYVVPEDTQLLNFSTILRVRMGDHFPPIDYIFGHEGSEPTLSINAIGYYGVLNNYSTYVIHSVKGHVGVQFSLEIIDTLLEEVQPDFYSIMESLSFEE